MNATNERFANRCLPLRIANQAGWFIRNPQTVDVLWHGGISQEDLQIRVHGQASSMCPMSHFGYGVVTWPIPYLFRTPENYNLAVRGPTNWCKDAAVPLDGIVETDWAVATFTMNWKITRPGIIVRFEEGEPICMISPQRRHEIEETEPEVMSIEEDPSLAAEYDQWSNSRRTFALEKRDTSVPFVWQKHYFLGATPSGSSFPRHQTKLHVKEFRVSLREDSELQPDDAGNDASVISAQSTIPMQGNPISIAYGVSQVPAKIRKAYDIHQVPSNEVDQKHIWSYLRVPAKGVRLSTDPGHLVDTEALVTLGHDLQKWTLATLGVPIVTYPCLNLYLLDEERRFACKQTEQPTLAYAISLCQSPDQSSVELAVETVQRSEGADDHRQAREFTTTALQFNDLIVYDPQRLHRIYSVQRTEEYSKTDTLLLEGELIPAFHCYPSIQEPGRIKALVDEALERVVKSLSSGLSLNGFATVNLSVEDGQTKRCCILLNKVNGMETAVAEALQTIVDRLSSSRFPERDLSLTIPVFFSC